MILDQLPRLKAALEIALTFLDGVSASNTIAVPDDEIDDARRAERELRTIRLSPAEIVELIRGDPMPDEASRIKALAPNFSHVLTSALGWQDHNECA